MSHLFQVQDAMLYGVDAAILLQHIRLWVATNAANNDHPHEGRHWVRCSMAGLQKLYPYLTVNQVRRSLDKLRDAGVLLAMHLDEGDRALWYTLATDTHVAKLPDTPQAKPETAATDAQETVRKSVSNGLKINKKSKIKELADVAYMPDCQSEKGETYVNELTKSSTASEPGHLAPVPNQSITLSSGHDSNAKGILTEVRESVPISDVAPVPHMPTLFSEPKNEERTKFSKRRIRHLTKKRRCTYLLNYTTYNTAGTKEKENTTNTTLHSVLVVKEKENSEATVLIPLTPKAKSKARGSAATSDLVDKKRDFDIAQVRRDLAIETQGPNAGLPVNPKAFQEIRIHVAKLMYNILGCPDSQYTKKRCMEESLNFIDYWNSMNWKRKGKDMLSLTMSVRTWVNNNYNKSYDKTPAYRRVEGSIAGVSSLAADLQRIAELHTGAGDEPAF